MPAQQVDFELDNVTVPCRAKDLRATFGWLLLEMRAVARVLRADERDLVRKLMSHAGPTLTVGDLFPDFQREGEEHKTLRRLRAAQFVYPKRTGRWEADEPIAVTPFGRLMWDQIGEGRIFSPPPPKPKEVSVDTRTPPPAAPKQVAVSWENLLERIRERQKTHAPGTTRQSQE